MHEMLF
nr:unnamed protein product [Callosobruchus analis]